ncbi:hypothetical protein V8J39_09390 [Frigidibacter sp. MR17.24]
MLKKLAAAGLAALCLSQAAEAAATGDAARDLRPRFVPQAAMLLEPPGAPPSVPGTPDPAPASLARGVTVPSPGGPRPARAAGGGSAGTGGWILMSGGSGGGARTATVPPVSPPGPILSLDALLAGQGPLRALPLAGGPQGAPLPDPLGGAVVPTVAPIPVPAGFVLGLSGLAALAGLRRRRRG